MVTARAGGPTFHPGSRCGGGAPLGSEPGAMGAYLDKPVTDKKTEEGDAGAGRLQYAVSEMQGWRKTMEDAHITNTRLTPEGHKLGQVQLFAVFDGHGGHEVAQFCSKYLPLVILEREEFNAGDFGEALIQSFYQIDDMLRHKSYAAELRRMRDGAQEEDNNDAGDEQGASASMSNKEQMQADVKQKMEAAEEKGSLSKKEALDLVMKMMRLKKMDESGNDGSESDGPQVTDAGCTAVAAIVHNNVLYVANAGDSRGVLCRAGKAVELSHDHKPFQTTELERIRKAGGFVNEVGRVNGSLNLSRSIGDLKFKQSKDLPPAEQVITSHPDIKTFQLTDQDEYFVLACDGVFDVLSNDALVKFINTRLSTGRTLSAIVEEIFEECICDDPGPAQGIGADNMTAMIVLLKPLSYFVS